MRIHKLGWILVSLVLVCLLGCQKTEVVSEGTEDITVEEQLLEVEISVEEDSLVKQENTDNSRKEVESVRQDVEQFLEQLTFHSGMSPLPAFDEIAELDVRLLTYIGAFNVLDGQESVAFTDVDQKVRQLFGQDITIDWDAVKVNPPWRFEVFDDVDELFIIGMGLPFVEFMAKVLEIEEVEAGYEAKIIYFDIDSFEMEVDPQFIYPVILQNGRIIGQVVEEEGSREYQFNVPLEQLTIHTFTFEYDEVENLILKRSEIENEFELVEDFTYELACEYAYDYFGVDSDHVIFDQRTEVPYQSMWSNEQLHLVRWVNLFPVDGEQGGSGGPTYWVSNYGQVYEDDWQSSLPGHRCYKYEDEIQFILSDNK